MKTLEQLGISPTPWKRGEWVPFCEDNIVRCDYKRNDGTPRTRIVASCNATFSTEQAGIDARLISAAPELYEALREIVADNKCGLMCSLCGAADKCKLRRAVAALEKAGGKE